MRAFTRELAAELGVPEECCAANVYISPGGGGVSKHFDDQHILVLHRVGAKLWTIAPNRSLAHPTAAA